MYRQTSVSEESHNFYRTTVIIIYNFDALLYFITMNTGKNSRLQTLYIPALLFIIAFFWKLLFINHRDICVDEPFTIFNAQKSIAGILKLPAEGEPNPPLFMIFVHAWIRLF